MVEVPPQAEVEAELRPRRRPRPWRRVDRAVTCFDWRAATDRPAMPIVAYAGGRLTAEEAARVRLLDGELARCGLFRVEDAAELIAERSHVFLAAAVEALRDGNVRDLRVL